MTINNCVAVVSPKAAIVDKLYRNVTTVAQQSCANILSLCEVIEMQDTIQGLLR